MTFFNQIRLKMDLKGHMINPNRLKMDETGKREFLDLKYLFFSGILLSGIGGVPPSPLNGKSSCPKTLSGNGGYLPPPLTEKIRKVVF